MPRGWRRIVLAPIFKNKSDVRPLNEATERRKGILYTTLANVINIQLPIAKNLVSYTLSFSSSVIMILTSFLICLLLNMISFVLI